MGQWGIGALIALVAIFGIVFVQAGRISGTNGGQQAANILSAAGGAGSAFVTALETGGGTKGT